MKSNYNIIAQEIPIMAKATIRRRKKVKRMNWMKKIVKNWADDSDDEGTQMKKASTPHVYLPADNVITNINGLGFKVHRASGGYVIETATYDQKTDRRSNNLYVVRDEDDLGNEIGKIITMECLRR